jgi:short-subunit dehydrogenase
VTHTFRSAIVTGGARGIGRAFAEALAARGASLVLADIDVDEAERTAETLRRNGATDLEVARVDVTRAEDLVELARAHPAPDLVIANAGVLVIGEAHETDVTTFRRAMDVNLFGVVHTCQAFAPSMLARGEGAFLNVASLAGLIPAPLMGCYAATKAAVIAYGDALRAELAPRGVTVTTLCPSFTRTELIERATGDDESARSIGHRIMGGLGASPDAVAKLGLDAASRGRAYAIPTLHARAARMLRGLSPVASTHLASAAVRFYRGMA